MKITLKLFSELGEYLPAGADGNALELAVPAATTAHALIDKFRVPRAEARVVMRNGEFMPEAQRDRPLEDGDVVSVWPSIQGG